MDNPDDILQRQAEVRERPFRSTVPVIGPAIAWLRARWSDLVARWYVLPMVEQQNAFNRLVVSQLAELEARLVAQDRQQTELIHRLAALTAELARLGDEGGEPMAEDEPARPADGP